jgi:hypothetical protein
MQCVCGWKKPLVCVVSLERSATTRLFVAIACPECRAIYDANEQEHEDVPDETISSMVDFVQDTLRRKLADA